MEREERPVPLGTPGISLFPPGINPGIALAAKNSSGSAPRSAPSANSSGIYLGAAPRSQIARGRTGAASPGGSRGGEAAAHPEGAAEFPRGKRRSWQNSRQRSWQNSRLEQQGRRGSGSSRVQIPGYDPGCGKGQFPDPSLIKLTGEMREFQGEGISWRRIFMEREFHGEGISSPFLGRLKRLGINKNKINQ